MNITPQSLEALFYTFDAAFQGGFRSMSPWYRRIATVVKSTGKENRYPWMEKLSKLREWIGERQVKNVASRAHTIVNKKWESTIEVDRDEIEDDSFGLYAPIFAELGANSVKLPDDVLGDLILNGHTNLCWDGQFFFDTDHPVDLDDASKGTYSNSLNLALTSANFATARKTMAQYKGVDGRPLGIRPTVLACGAELEVTARQILQATMTAPAGAVGQNAANTVQENVLKGMAEPLIIDDLDADPTAWFLLDVSRPIKPFIWQERRPVKLVQLVNETDANVFLRSKYMYGVDGRAAGGYSLPQLALRSKP